MAHTGLSWFYDYQSNGGGVRHVDVDPSDGVIHVVHMLSEDSAAVDATLRTGYAYSDDNGATLPSSLVELYPDGRIIGDETLGVWVERMWFMLK